MLCRSCTSVADMAVTATLAEHNCMPCQASLLPLQQGQKQLLHLAHITLQAVMHSQRVPSGNCWRGSHCHSGALLQLQATVQFCCRSNRAMSSCFIWPTSLCKLSSLVDSSATAAAEVAATESTCWLKLLTVEDTWGAHTKTWNTAPRSRSA